MSVLWGGGLGSPLTSPIHYVDEPAETQEGQSRRI